MPATELPLVELLRRVTQAFVDELVTRLQAAGYPDITSAHHPVFYNLDPGGTRLTELAVRARMTHQSMGELVGVLERLGYVSRRPDPADGRARLVELTRRGTAAVRRARAEVSSIEAAWASRFRRAGIEVDVKQAFATALADHTSPPRPPTAR